jgi:hypothetical protein
MTDTCHVGKCDNPLPHDTTSTACPGCWNKLEQALAEMPWLTEQLDLTISHQNTGPKGPRSAEKPLPYDVGASDALELLHRTMWPWVKEHLSVHPDAPFRGSPNAVGLARHLLRGYPWLKRHNDGHTAVEEITYAVRIATRAIDIQKAPAYLGPCDTPDCPADLYVRPGSAAAKCHLCGQVVNVADKNLDAYHQATTRPWTLYEATTIIRNAGMTPATPEQVTRWVRNGRIVPVHDPSGQALYRLADLITDAGA